MDRSEQHKFYEPSMRLGEPRVFDPKFPVLSWLHGLFGQPVIEDFKKIAEFYKEKNFVEHNLYNNEKAPTIVAMGKPGIGKSTTLNELEALFSEHGYSVKRSSYEQILDQWHLVPEKDYDPETWHKVNRSLYRQATAPYGLYPKPIVKLIETPGLAKIMPRQSRPKKFTGNRNRGASFLYMLHRDMLWSPIYVMALTGEKKGRLESVSKRLEISQQPLETINDYLHAHDLLAPDKVVNSGFLLKLLDHMAQPKHLQTIENEFLGHQEKFIEKVLPHRYELIETLQELHRAFTDTEPSAFFEMLTLNYLLAKMQIPVERIIHAYNGFNPHLQATFFNQIAEV